MEEGEKKKFYGFDDSDIELEQERLVNRNKNCETNNSVREGESLWDYIKRMEKEDCEVNN